MKHNERDGSLTFLTNHETFDGNSSTCFTGENTPLKLRFPWPTSNSNSLTFTVNVTGENLLCKNHNSWTGKNGLIVYVPLDYQVDSKFTGNFLSCNLKVEKATSCEYVCSCNNKMCQAFYVNLHDNYSSIKICEITTLLE